MESTILMSILAGALARKGALGWYQCGSGAASGFVPGEEALRLANEMGKCEVIEDRAGADR